MPPKHFKSLTLPDASYAGIQRARAQLQQLGTDAIPDELLHPPQCPSCGGAVEHLNVGVEHIRCGGCGYSQQTVSVNGNSFAPFATGALVGAAFAALFFYMSRDREERLPTARGAPVKKLPAKRTAASAPKKKTMTRKVTRA